MPRSPSPRRSASPDHKPKQWTQRRPKELSFYKRSAQAYGQPQRPVGVMEEEEETAKERAQRRERGMVPKRFGGTREQGVRNTMGNVSGAIQTTGGMGSFKRTGDPLDRMGVKGEKKRDRDDREKRERERAREERDREYRRDVGRDRREERKREDKDIIHPDRAAAATEDGKKAPVQITGNKIRAGRMMEVIANDRMGRKVTVKCLPTDTVGDLKKLIAAQTGTNPQKIVLKKWWVGGWQLIQVHCVQGSHCAAGLRDQRRDGGWGRRWTNSSRSRCTRPEMH